MPKAQNTIIYLHQRFGANSAPRPSLLIVIIRAGHCARPQIGISVVSRGASHMSHAIAAMSRHMARRGPSPERIRRGRYDVVEHIQSYCACNQRLRHAVVAGLGERQTKVVLTVAVVQPSYQTRFNQSHDMASRRSLGNAPTGGTS